MDEFDENRLHDLIDRIAREVSYEPRAPKYVYTLIELLRRIIAHLTD